MCSSYLIDISFPHCWECFCMSAVTAIDGIFVGHGVGSDGIAAINICIPLLMFFTGVGLMVGAGCSVVASIHISRGKEKIARMNVTQALLFATLVTSVPSIIILLFPDATGRLLGSSEHLLPFVKTICGGSCLRCCSRYGFPLRFCYSAGRCATIGDSGATLFRQPSISYWTGCSCSHWD